MDFIHRRRLNIDLTTKKITITEIPEKVLSLYIGGIGLGSYYAYREIPAKIDPLDEKNKLFLCIGPAQGTFITLTGRYCLVTKSPLTGFLLDSHAGGIVGALMAFLKFGLISISGKADRQVYITIFDEGVEIHDWTYGKGLTTHQTEELLKKKYFTNEREKQMISVLSIGPAGENLIPYSCLVNDRYRNLGRGGSGAVFGSKNLKAIVFRTSNVFLKSSEKITELADTISSRIRASRRNGHLLLFQGTPWLVNLSNERSMFPTRNFQEGFFSEHEKISGDALEKYKLRKKGCFRCTLNCGRVIKNTSFDWTTDDEVGAPEYETLGLLGGNLGITDLEAIIQMNHQCNAYGLDTISTGSSLGFLTELKKRLLLPDSLKEFEDEIPDFGETEKFLALIPKIVLKEGIGDFLSLGPAEMAERSANPEEAKKFAIHVKKLPMAAWDPRGKFLMGLSYATAAVGASHLRGWSTTIHPPITFDENNPEHIKDLEDFIEQIDLKIIKDVLIICHFSNSIDPVLNITDTIDLLNGLTDFNWSLSMVRNLAQRIWIVQRMFNVREMDEPSKYDTLPYRLLKEPLSHNPAKGRAAFTSEEEFSLIKRLYYQKRGLDSLGRPLPETIQSLKIE